MMINEYDGILYIFWDQETNLFYDPCGIRISNIFEWVTPNDLFLFRSNPKEHCAFMLKENPKILCMLLINEEGYP